MVRTPAKVLDSPDQSPVLFEFQVSDTDSSTSVNTTATDSFSSSSVAAAATPRLSYLVSGPGASDSWAAVPAVPAAEWEELLVLAGKNGTSSSSSAAASGGEGFVWGLKLESLDDGEYRLQVGWAGCVEAGTGGGCWACFVVVVLCGRRSGWPFFFGRWRSTGLS